MRIVRSQLGLCVIGVASTLATVCLSLQAQTTAVPQAKKVEQNRDLDGRFAPKSLQTGEGVILKIDTVGESKKGEHRPRRIEINQNVVWRDWVRDQAAVKDVQRANTAAAAAKGKTSVATVGQPSDTNSIVILEVPVGTKIETRFRSSTDEITQGATTPGRAATAEKAADADDKESQAKEKSAPKPKAHPDPAAPGTQLTDLKAGLFVEYEYTAKSGKNVASRVRIMRPVGGPNTSAAQSKPN